MKLSFQSLEGQAFWKCDGVEDEDKNDKNADNGIYLCPAPACRSLERPLLPRYDDVENRDKTRASYTLKGLNSESYNGAILVLVYS